MKLLKTSLIISLLIFTSTICKAQGYASLEYWGKDYKLDRTFFEYLNANYKTYMEEKAPQWKYYDFKDYQAIYIEFVNNLKSMNFTIVVTEANQVQWKDPIGVLPGTDGEKGRSSKSHSRASFLIYNVVLPSLQQFVKGK